MKHFTRRAVQIFTLLMILLMGTSLPVNAALSQTFLTENHLFTAEEDFYTESIQGILESLDSPLAAYTETLSDQTASAAEIIWLGSQTKEFGINPKVLLVSLYASGWLNQPPTELMTPFVQNMAQTLWDGYIQYLSGSRSVTLSGGAQVTFSGSNPATFALATLLAPGSSSESDLSARMTAWKTAYQDLFGVDPAVDRPQSDPHSVTGVKPFLQLPFAQSDSSFIAVNSFFDHAVPGVFDDSILRFDGKTVSGASFSTCLLGVSCYGGHNGIDYKTGAGMPIYAAAAGTVVYKYYNTNPSAGTVDSGLYIDHDNGYRTAYWHMDPIEVEYGQTVKAGDLIGYSGNIGQSSGAHLHFGLRMVNGNKAVDPFGWWSTTVTDTWGGSDWMWGGDSIADMGEAQTQLFYRSYWYKVDSGYNGSSFWTYEVSTSGSSTNWAVWGTYIETAGQYRVYAYWPSDSTNTTNAKYKIFYSGGATTVSVNQATNGDKFVLLGTYNFGIGSAAVIMNDYTGGSGGKVRFDAVKWEPINAPTSTPTRTPTVTATAKPTATSTASGAKLTNIAVGKPASQSSVYRDSTTSGIPVLAVDGNTNGDYFSGSVTHTKDEANPWWQVDLGAVQSIEKINLWNRTSCCSERLSNFYVFVSNTPFTSTSISQTLAQPGVDAYYYAGAAPASAEININRTGRYIRVQLTGTNPLSLAEVQVWSPDTLATAVPTSATTAPAATQTPAATLTATATFTSTATATSTPTHTPTPLPTNSGTSETGAELNNIAKGKSATQSSQYGTDSVRGKPWLAVDGKTSGVYDNNSVTHTKSEAGAWWQVDLGGVQNISKISVWNRTDCCSDRLSNFYVFVSDVPFTSNTVAGTLAQSGVGAYYFSGKAPVTTEFAIDRTGRYVRVQLSGTNFLSLAEVQVWSPDIIPTPTPTVTKSATPNAQGQWNIAKGMTATQSSVYRNSTTNGIPGLAVDGKTNGNYFSNSVTHTQSEGQPWWQVDLGQSQYINKISIWNRTDCCSSRLSAFYVFVSDEPFTSTQPGATKSQPGVSSYYFSGKAGTTTNFTINHTGRYVRVQLTGTNYLSLAEVQVWSDLRSITPTPTPTTSSILATLDPSAYYKIQTGSPAYLPNFAHPESGDNWLGVGGQVINENGTPVNQILVVVKGTLNGVTINKSAQIGANTDYGAGGFEIVLGSTPLASTGKLSITLYSLTGVQISNTITFDTFADPLKNLVLINFIKQ